MQIHLHRFVSWLIAVALAAGASGRLFAAPPAPQAIPGNNAARPVAPAYAHATVYETAGYTEDGLRAWKQNGGARTYFLYDDTLPVLALNSSGAVSAVNTFGANGLLSRRTGGASTFYTFDPQGSVCQRLSSAGTVLSTDIYDGYGVGQSTTSNSDPWAFGAQWGYTTDRETGLLLLTNRYYDPGAGQFVTRDPAGYGGGINLYGYAGNSPVSSIDPLGLCGQPGRDFLWDFSDLVSGFGYAVTGGGIQAIWRAQGTDAYVNQGSGWFRGGEALGVAHAVATVGVGTGAFRLIGGRLVALAGTGVVASTSQVAQIVEEQEEEVAPGIDPVARYYELLQEAESLYPSKAGKFELHHIDPKYLGGDPEGPLERIPAAYHQLITNAFRDEYAYGQDKLSAEVRAEIGQRVYSQYPLPSSLGIKY